MASDNPFLHIAPNDPVELQISIGPGARYADGSFAQPIIRGSQGVCTQTRISLRWMKFYVRFNGETSERVFDYFDKQYLNNNRPLKRIGPRTLP